MTPPRSARKRQQQARRTQRRSATRRRNRTHGYKASVPRRNRHERQTVAILDAPPVMGLLYVNKVADIVKRLTTPEQDAA